MDQTPLWPYLPTLYRLALALAVGLFVGIERERRRKEAGLRTFAFAALMGAIGGLLGTPFALLALGLIGLLVVLLNVETIHTGEGAEITTSAALLVVGYAGVLAGQGHTFTPATLGIATAALLAWKEPLAGFSQTLTESELRSAVLLAILAFIIFPVLPRGTIDPWQLIRPREIWITVLIIAALGFVNYILLKRYGARGLEFTGFLGGLVNSTVMVSELAQRAAGAAGRLSDATFPGVILAVAAMLLRNAIILGLLAPATLLACVVPFAAMFIGAMAVPLRRRPNGSGEVDEGYLRTLSSPFSLVAALRFGLIFLAIEIAGTLAQRSLGQAGFYAVSFIGGLVSSASAVASAAALAATGAVSPGVAGLGAVIASVTSALVTIPLLARFGKDRALTRRVSWVLAGLVVLGAAGAAVQLVVFGV